MWLSAFLFLLLVWPTPYEYFRRTSDLYRINRFTGVKEFASSSGWKTEGTHAEVKQASSNPLGTRPAVVNLPDKTFGTMRQSCRIEFDNLSAVLRAKVSAVETDPLHHTAFGGSEYRIHFDNASREKIESVPNNLFDPSRSHPTISFVDGNGFTLRTVDAPKMDWHLTGNITQRPTCATEFEFEVPMAAAEFQRIKDWHGF